MAPNDIYNSKEKYQRFLAQISELTNPPEKRPGHRPHHCTKYIIRNPKNVRWFLRLAAIFDAHDRSYVRRLRVMRSLKLIAHATTKNLEACDREEINRIVSFAHSRCHTPASKVTFLKDLKFIWRQMFPELDAKGRPDETLTPYPVRHLVARCDVSRKRTPRDKASPNEVQSLIAAFAGDQRMQAFVALQYESLARPQELLYRRIRDVELHDNYAKIEISDHGKEGTGILQCIDSFPYLAAWMNRHPFRDDQSAFLFCRLDTIGPCQQMGVASVNGHLRRKLRQIGLNKPITGYSLKRNGVTHRRLRGDSDVAIQHVARWTSTRPLMRYDQSNPNDTFNMELARRGLIVTTEVNAFGVRPKTCTFCQTINGSTELVCTTCKRPLDREKIEADIKAREADRRDRENDRAEMEDLRGRLTEISRYLGVASDQNSTRLSFAIGKPDRPLPGTAKTT